MPRTSGSSKAIHGGNHYRVPALERGLDILQALSESDGNGLKRSEIAEAVQCSKSQLFRALRCLEHRSLVARKADERYALSPSLHRLFAQQLPREALITRALPCMRVLSNILKQTCHLTALDDVQLVTLAHAVPEGVIGVTRPAGFTQGIVDGAAGVAVLAFTPSTLRNWILDGWSERERRPVPVELSERLKAVQLSGVAVMQDPDLAFVTEIAAPILDVSGQPIAALAVAYCERQRGSLDVTAAKAETRRAAGRISTEMGWWPASAAATGTMNEVTTWC